VLLYEVGAIGEWSAASGWQSVRVVQSQERSLALQSLSRTQPEPRDAERHPPRQRKP
jgi:hypothetical protein